MQHRSTIMKQRIRRAELDEKALKAGLTVQHDCGGYRLVRDDRMIFPDTGICSTATARECIIFLLGVLWKSGQTY